MVKLLIGQKGSGKTKKLLGLIDEAFEKSQGHVVCIEKGESLRYSVSYKIRLVSADDYRVSGYDAFYGLLAGICAGNHDITDILIDATLRIGTRDMDELAAFLTKVKELSDKTETNFTFTVSTDKENLPASVFEFCEVE